MRITGDNNGGLLWSDVSIDSYPNQPTPPVTFENRGPFIRNLRVDVEAGNIVVLTVERLLRADETYVPEPNTFDISRSFDDCSGLQTITSRHMITSLDISTDGLQFQSRMGRNPATGIEPTSPPETKQPEIKPEEPLKPKEFPSPIPDLDI